MRHDSYLPSSLATLEALDRREYAMVNAIAPPDVRIVGPHFIVSSYSPSLGRRSFGGPRWVIGGSPIFGRHPWVPAEN